MNTALSLQLNSSPITAAFGCKIRPFPIQPLPCSNTKLSATIHPLPGQCSWPQLESRIQSWPDLLEPLLCSSAYGFVADKLKLINSITEQGLWLIGLRAKNSTLIVSEAVRVWSEMFECCCLMWACSSSCREFGGQGRLSWSCAQLAVLQRQESWAAAELVKPPATA